ncbi:MAG TPA: hypothetical protein VMY42_09805 [Thermoguttaceae bacterium]|nr:hypothetical protein [Thermoguttaceae bacterium]
MSHQEELRKILGPWSPERQQAERERITRALRNFARGRRWARVKLVLLWPLLKLGFPVQDAVDDQLDTIGHCNYAEEEYEMNLATLEGRGTTHRGFFVEFPDDEDSGYDGWLALEDRYSD